MGAEGIIEGKTNFQKILDSKKFGKNWPRLQDSNFHGSPENGNIGKSLDEQMKESAKMRTTKDPTDLKNDVGLKYRLPTPTYTVLGGRKFAGKTPALEDNNLYSPDLKGIAGGYRTGFDEATEIGLKEKDAAIEKGNFLDSIAYLDQIAANGNAWKGYSTFHVGVYPGANKGENMQCSCHVLLTAQESGLCMPRRGSSWGWYHHLPLSCRHRRPRLHCLGGCCCWRQHQIL